MPTSSKPSLIVPSAQSLKAFANQFGPALNEKELTFLSTRYCPVPYSTLAVEKMTDPKELALMARSLKVEVRDKVYANKHTDEQTREWLNDQWGTKSLSASERAILSVMRYPDSYVAPIGLRDERNDEPAEPADPEMRFMHTIHPIIMPRA